MILTSCVSPKRVNASVPSNSWQDKAQSDHLWYMKLFGGPQHLIGLEFAELFDSWDVRIGEEIAVKILILCWLEPVPWRERHTLVALWQASHARVKVTRVRESWHRCNDWHQMLWNVKCILFIEICFSVPASELRLCLPPRSESSCKGCIATYHALIALLVEAFCMLCQLTTVLTGRERYHCSRDNNCPIVQIILHHLPAQCRLVVVLVSMDVCPNKAPAKEMYALKSTSS